MMRMLPGGRPPGETESRESRKKVIQRYQKGVISRRRLEKMRAQGRGESVVGRGREEAQKGEKGDGHRGHTQRRISDSPFRRSRPTEQRGKNLFNTT